MEPGKTMKTKDFISLAMTVGNYMPSMVVHGQMMLVVPVGQILRGVYFEGSGFDAKSFYVWVFWLPLYVPQEHISFNFGRRIRDASGGDRWNADSPQLLEGLVTAVRRDAVSFLSRLGMAKDEEMVRIARAAAAKSKDVYAHEALAYALARAGDTEAAIEAIDVLLKLLDPAIHWQAELGTRANLIKGKLLCEANKVGVQLDKWRAESIRKLKIERLV
jgi:hypothetical protein